jgi:hypothetical protein
MEFLASVLLLIIDDLGMRKVPSTRRRRFAGDRYAPL